MARTVTAAVHREDAVYVARALEVEVTSQGPTIQESLDALREALELYAAAADETSTLAHPLVTTLQIA